MRLFVDSWTSSWTLVLGLGYIGRKLYWPGLSALNNDTSAKAMVLTSLAVVLALCVIGFSAAAFAIAGWAICISLLRRTVDTLD